MSYARIISVKVSSMILVVFFLFQLTSLAQSDSSYRVGLDFKYGTLQRAIKSDQFDSKRKYYTINRSFGVVFEMPHKRTFLSGEGYVQSSTAFFEGYVTAQINPYDLPPSWRDNGRRMYYAVNFKRVGVTPKINLIVNSPSSRLQLLAGIGLGLEKTFYHSVTNDYYHTWDKRYEWQTDSLNVAHVITYTLSPDVYQTATQKFEIRHNQTTAVISPYLKIQYTAFKTMDVGAELGMRYYANPYLGILGDQYLRATYYIGFYVSYLI